MNIVTINKYYQIMYILDSVNSIENLTLKAMDYMFFTAVWSEYSTSNCTNPGSYVYTKDRHTQCVINCG